VPIRFLRLRFPVLLGAGLLTGSALLVAAQDPLRGSATGEWPSYGGDLASTKYSPLAQITGENISRLRVAWSAPSPDAYSSVSTPGGVAWSGQPARRLR
jgi:hypothetical protein